MIRKILLSNEHHDSNSHFLLISTHLLQRTYSLYTMTSRRTHFSPHTDSTKDTFLRHLILSSPLGHRGGVGSASDALSFSRCLTSGKNPATVRGGASEIIGIWPSRTAALTVRFTQIPIPATWPYRERLKLIFFCLIFCVPVFRVYT